MEFPIIIFLTIYLITVFIFLIFTFFNLYHAWRFGINNFTNFFMISLYIVILLIIAFASARFIYTVDWNQTLIINLF